MAPSAHALKRLAVSESGFIFDPVSGNHFTVNDTGLEILGHLQHGKDLREVLQILSREYNASDLEMERDVVEFAGMLRKFIGE